MNSSLTRTNRMTTLVVVALMAVAMACVLGPLANKAYAADVNFEDTSAETWVVGPEGDDNLTGANPINFVDANGDFLFDAVITNAKSSNKKVAKVKVYEETLWIYYGMKTGKTTISCTVNGVPMKHTFQVKYTCPVAKFSVGGKSMLKQFKKKNSVKTKTTYKNKKVVIKTKKNWVITHVALIKSGKYKETDLKNKKKYSAKISTKWPYDGIALEFKNAKTGEKQSLTFKKAYDMRYAQAG